MFVAVEKSTFDNDALRRSDTFQSQHYNNLHMSVQLMQVYVLLKTCWASTIDDDDDDDDELFLWYGWPTKSV